MTNFTNFTRPPDLASIQPQPSSVLTAVSFSGTVSPKAITELVDSGIGMSKATVVVQTLYVTANVSKVARFVATSLKSLDKVADTVGLKIATKHRVEGVGPCRNDQTREDALLAYALDVKPLGTALIKMDILKAAISANQASSTRLDKTRSSVTQPPCRTGTSSPWSSTSPTPTWTSAKLEQHAGVSSGNYTAGLSQTRMCSCRRSTQLPGQGRHRRDH